MQRVQLSIYRLDVVFLWMAWLIPLGGCAGSSVAAPPATGLAVQPDQERTRPKPLVYLAANLSAAQQLELSELAPNLSLLSGLTDAEALAQAPHVHAADAHLCTPEFLRAATQLRWVQASSAGVDRYVRIPELISNPQIVLTNMQGVHGPAIAEHAFAMLLSLTRGLDTWRDAQREGLWRRDQALDMTTLAGRTMLVVGMGGIGSQIARRAKAFDMQVLATVRSARETPDYVDELGLSADLERWLPRADVVAIALPLTPETEGLFGAETLALCKPGAYLINIGRGRIVDSEALNAVLESGALAGACLDVTDPEPLPAGHPLWARADVVLTPHVAGRAEITGERRWAVYRDQLRRFAHGEPLENVVDVALGY